MSKRSSNEKLRILFIAGVAGLIAGYALGFVTPIIKRICTSSFVIVSGGWTVLALGFSYWLIDLKKRTRVAWFFAIVGMNPLFIYLFAHVGGANLVEEILHPFTMALFGWMGELGASIMTSLIGLFFLWYMCYWLYRRKIYIKI